MEVCKAKYNKNVFSTSTNGTRFNISSDVIYGKIYTALTASSSITYTCTVQFSYS